MTKVNSIRPNLSQRNMNLTLKADEKKNVIPIMKDVKAIKPHAFFVNCDVHLICILQPYG